MEGELRYAIQLNFIGRWDFVEWEGQKLITYPTWIDAYKEIVDGIISSREAYERGDMSDPPEPDEWRVVELTAEQVRKAEAIENEMFPRG